MNMTFNIVLKPILHRCQKCLNKLNSHNRSCRAGFCHFANAAKILTDSEFQEKLRPPKCHDISH